MGVTSCCCSARITYDFNSKFHAHPNASCVKQVHGHGSTALALPRRWVFRVLLKWISRLSVQRRRATIQWERTGKHIERNSYRMQRRAAPSACQSTTRKEETPWQFGGNRLAINYRIAIQFISRGRHRWRGSICGGRLRCDFGLQWHWMTSAK